MAGVRCVTCCAVRRRGRRRCLGQELVVTRFGGDAYEAIRGLSAALAEPGYPRAGSIQPAVDAPVRPVVVSPVTPVRVLTRILIVIAPVIDGHDTYRIFFPKRGGQRAPRGRSLRHKERCGSRGRPNFFTIYSVKRPARFERFGNALSGVRLLAIECTNLPLDARCRRCLLAGPSAGRADAPGIAVSRPPALGINDHGHEGGCRPRQSAQQKPQRPRSRAPSRRQPCRDQHLGSNDVQRGSAVRGVRHSRCVDADNPAPVFLWEPSEVRQHNEIGRSGQ
jgi:hypothetical protein